MKAEYAEKAALLVDALKRLCELENALNDNDDEEPSDVALIFDGFEVLFDKDTGLDLVSPLREIIISQLERIGVET